MTFKTNGPSQTQISFLLVVFH